MSSYLGILAVGLVSALLFPMWTQNASDFELLLIIPEGLLMVRMLIAP